MLIFKTYFNDCDGSYVWLDCIPIFHLQLLYPRYYLAAHHVCQASHNKHYRKLITLLELLSSFVSISLFHKTCCFLFNFVILQFAFHARREKGQPSIIVLPLLFVVCEGILLSLWFLQLFQVSRHSLLHYTACAIKEAMVQDRTRIGVKQTLIQIIAHLSLLITTSFSMNGQPSKSQCGDTTCE